MNPLKCKRPQYWGLLDNMRGDQLILYIKHKDGRAQ